MTPRKSDGRAAALVIVAAGLFAIAGATIVGLLGIARAERGWGFDGDVPAGLLFFVSAWLAAVGFVRWNRS